MRTISPPAAMQRCALRWRREGRRIALVPTMGCLHEGHLSLVRHARRWIGPEGRVVVSVYVNPTQFGPTEDFARYPRPFERDLELCRDAGVDLVFHPLDRDMYPGRESGDYSTYVVEERLTRHLEGRSRPTHFRGVTTVVAKLFHLVLPDLAVFGAKDWQQSAVIRRMVNDLHIPVRLVVSPTVRESDGLALSSRNRYLSPQERQEATVLWQALGLARARVRAAGGPLSAGRLTGELRRHLESAPSAKVDYIAFHHPATLEPVEQVRRGTHLSLAVFIGTTRLIDNVRL